MIFTIYSDPTAYKNGLIVPSGSVPYFGAALQILTLSTVPVQLPCNPNLNQVLNFFDQAVYNLLEQNDLTQINPQTLDFNPATITIKGLHQIEVNEISAANASIEALQTQFAGLTANDIPLTINMGCLAAAAAPCQTSPNVYPTGAVMNTFLAEICAIKTYLGI